MPSTTNSLEATHGHLKAITPRRNSLFASIFRIHNEMNSKFLNINQRIQHNYDYTKRKTAEKVKNIKHETFELMCVHYSTSKKFCLCSENKLVSSSQKIDIPCSHRLSKGETFPDLPKINLNLIHQYSNFVPVEKKQEDEKTDEMEYIVKTIKFFSHYNCVEQITMFVEKHYKSDAGFFINNQVSIIQLIKEGIYHFQQIKKTTNKKKAQINKT